MNLDLSIKEKRVKKIKKYLDRIRKDIPLKTELQLLRWIHLERMEKEAIEKNTDESVAEIKDYVERTLLKITDDMSIEEKLQVMRRKMSYD